MMSFFCHSGHQTKTYNSLLFKKKITWGLDLCRQHTTVTSSLSQTRWFPFLRLKNAKAEYLTRIKLCICINKVIKELMAETLEKWQAVNYTAHDPHVLKKWEQTGLIQMNLRFQIFGESKTGGSVTGSLMSASKRSMKLWTQKSTIVIWPTVRCHLGKCDSQQIHFSAWPLNARALKA